VCEVALFFKGHTNKKKSYIENCSTQYLQEKYMNAKFLTPIDHKIGDVILEYLGEIEFIFKKALKG
jgi:hypothetical protein